MKQEQLLEAIGSVSEDMLLETEQPVRRSVKGVRRAVLVAAIVVILAVTAAASTGMLTGLLKAEDNGSSAANLATGMGCFVYNDGYIYLGEPGYICKYDAHGKLLKTYPLRDRYETPLHLFATEDAIIYVNCLGVSVEPVSEDAPTREQFWSLCAQPKDGSKPETICADIAFTGAYADGDQLYATDGGAMLTRIDLVTMEKTELLENVSEYYVDDTYIYAVQSNDEKCYFRSPKDAIAFEKIELDFAPNKVVADGEDLYFCQWIEKKDRTDPDVCYQVNLVRDGVTTPLPINSWFYQILDGCVIYRETDTYILKSYDLTTGETVDLQENVFEFSVLEDRYICIYKLYNEKPVLLDWQTGEVTQLSVPD